jgi:hypothetical protein
MSTDPRFAGFTSPVSPPGASNADRAISQLWAALGDLQRQNADLRREVRDLRAAPTIQVAGGLPAASGYTGREGTPYASVAGPSFWVRIGGAWRGVNLPLT